MNFTYVAMFILFLVLVIVILKLTKQDQENNLEYEYFLKEILTPAEKSFYNVLKLALNEHNIDIFAQVRIADILEPKKTYDKSNRTSAFNKIKSKHFDFIICNTNDLSIICVIELNDRSHMTKKRQERDKFVENICLSANLRLIMIKAQKSYNTEELKHLIIKEAT